MKKVLYQSATALLLAAALWLIFHNSGSDRSGSQTVETTVNSAQIRKFSSRLLSQQRQALPQEAPLHSSARTAIPTARARDVDQKIESLDSFVEINSTAVGNRFYSHGQIIEVNAYQTDPIANLNTFSVVFTPAPEPVPEAENIALSGVQPVSTPATGLPADSSEMALFRMKWGWAAYAQLQKAAQQEEP